MPLVKFVNVGALGLDQDSAPNDVAAVPAGRAPAFAWTGGGNVRFKEGYVEKFLGHNAPNGTPVVTPYGIFFSNGTSGLYEVYTGLQKVYAVQDTTHTNITRQTAGSDVNYTGTIDNKWTGSTISSTLILNNQVDVPQAWGGNIATRLSALSAWPSGVTCKSLRAFDNVLVALNVTESGTNYKSMVRVSTPADPGTVPASWDYTDPTNESIRVEGVLASTPDAITDGLQLGNQFMIYKENSTYAMELSGGEFVYRFFCVSKESGCLGIDCAAAFPGGHAVLADGDIVLNVGIDAPQSIIDRRMRRWLFNNLDSDNRQRSFAVTNIRRNEVWFCFPAIGMTWPNLAAVWNYKENTWGVRDLPNLTHANAGVISASSTDTWDSRTDIWDEADGIWAVDEYSKTTKRVMMASVDTALYLADIGRSFAGTPMSAYVEHTGMDFGQPELIKMCKGVRPRFDSAAGTIIQIYVGYQNDLEDAITWGTAMPYVTGTDLKVDCFVAGRYLAIKFQTDGQPAWRMAQFDMEIEAMGEY